jgi:hypothetical protein
MVKMPDTRGKYFSVKNSTKIQGVRYTPSVCYPLSSGLQAVVEEMAAKDMAKIHTGKVRFVTGVPYPVEKAETGAAAPKTITGAGADTRKVSAEAAKPGRKSGRSAYTPQAK